MTTRRIIKALPFCLVFFLAGCMMHKSSNMTATSPNSSGDSDIVLRRLSYQDGILEGEVLNQSKKTAQVVMVEVSFLDSSGKPLFAQDFRAVPGGDGHALLPKSAKHFNYKVTLGQSSKIAVAGRIKSISCE